MSAGNYKNNIIVNDFGGNVDDYEKCVAKSKDCKPKGMTDEQSSVWDDICPLLFQEKRMKALFVSALHKYCRFDAEINKCLDLLDKNGWDYKTSKDGRNGEQIKSRPEAVRLRFLMNEYKPLVAQFGLTPGTEARFRSGQMGLPLDDEWNSF